MREEPNILFTTVNPFSEETRADRLYSNDSC